MDLAIVIISIWAISIYAHLAMGRRDDRRDRERRREHEARMREYRRQETAAKAKTKALVDSVRRQLDDLDRWQRERILRMLVEQRRSPDERMH